jgi:hypothetical protein
MPERERVGRNGAAEKLRAAEDQQTHARTPFAPGELQRPVTFRLDLRDGAPRMRLQMRRD